MITRHNRPVAHRGLRQTLTAVLACLSLLAVVATPVSAGEKATIEAESIVVKLEPGEVPDRVTTRFGLILGDPLVPSLGLHRLIRTEESALTGGKYRDKKLKDVVKDVAKATGVEWAELEVMDESLTDDRFHAWPDGLPTDHGTDPTRWLDQPNLGLFELERVHSRTTGAGITVALLDTGVDVNHPSLVDHLAPTGTDDRAGGPHFDYIDDDRVPMEAADGIDDDGDGSIDEAYGHGTHTAGLVALVAPDAELLVYRVLDADGVGNTYVVAQAINDAVAAGADVINLSFGMNGKPRSKVLKEALKNAEKQNVAIVAAVGNGGDDGPRFPSREKNIIGVAAMANGNAYLAGFSNYGKPALVAAPGEDIVSTLPGGGFGSWSGTSMAAPIVTGQVALVRSTHRDLKVKKVIEIVGKSARKLKGKRSVEKGVIDILRSVDYS